MRFTAEAVRGLLAILPQYDGLPQFERQQLTSFDHRSQTYSTWDFGNTLPRMIKAGFVVKDSCGRILMEPSRKESILMLKSLLDHAVFDRSSEVRFNGYLESHLTAEEGNALRGNSQWALYPILTSPDWVQGFLNATDPSWEEPYRVPGESLFANPEILHTTQSIVRWLMGREDGRAILRNLPALADSALMSAAIHAGLRYALLFADIDSRTMEVTLGVWPTVVPEPSVEVPLPRNVTPEETFDPLFLLEDMTTLLVSFAADAPKLRDKDELYAPKIRALARQLQPLPKWVDEEFEMDRELRVSTAVSFLYGFKLVKEIAEGYFHRHLYASDGGQAWIGLPAGDRLRVLLDGVLDRKQSVPAFAQFKGAKIGATTDDFEIDTKATPLPNIRAAMLAPFRALEGSGFFPMQEVVEYGQITNPLLEVYRKDTGAWFKSGGSYVDRPDRKKLRKIWADELHYFLRERLAPMGCVRVGRGKDGLSIAITPVGRYFLGQTKEWLAADPHSQVIVQPNFDVTFLGESAVAEAEIGRFAERRGRTGVRFQITKKSILAAAMQGMTVEKALGILDRVSTREVPANVRREIQGWFGQYREVNIESVIVIRCPDQETAMRVMALAKNLVTPLTETLLAYRNPDFRQHDGIVKKLQEMGVRVLVRGQPSDSDRYRQLIGG